MSYCRWSSDNWKCDVYCYGSGHGFTTHVAGNKTVGDAPELDWSLMDDPNDKAALALFQKQYETQMAWLSTAERKPIGLAYDGESFDDPDLKSFLATLIMLKKAGYNVPDYVIEDVRSELFQFQQAKLK